MGVTALERRPMGIAAIPLGAGRWVTIRPIESSDWNGLLDFYRRLSADARYTRFLGMTSGIGGSVARRYSTARDRGADGFVAVLREVGPADGAIVAHLCMEPDRAGATEVAVAVADGMRRLGVGSALMAAAMRSAQSSGARRLTASMFAGNEPMRRLFLGAGGQLVHQSIDAGVESMEIDPRAA